MKGIRQGSDYDKVTIKCRVTQGRKRRRNITIKLNYKQHEANKECIHENDDAISAQGQPLVKWEGRVVEYLRERG